MQERKYLKNISPATITFYQSCFKALPLNPETWKADLLVGIERLKGRTVKPRSINDHIRGNKAFLAGAATKEWSRSDQDLLLKEEQKILATFTGQHVKALLSFEPKGKNRALAHGLCRRRWTFAPRFFVGNNAKVPM